MVDGNKVLVLIDAQGLERREDNGVDLVNIKDCQCDKIKD